MRFTRVNSGSAFLAVAVFAIGCSSAKNDATDGMPAMGGNPGAAGSDSKPATSMGGAGKQSSGSSGSSAGSGGSSSSGSKPGDSAGSSGSSGAAGSDNGSGGSEPPPPPPPELDPNVDWTALKLVYAPMYSAYNGGANTFQVPVHVDGATVELSGWQAVPASAVIIEADPSVAGGVMLTVSEDVPEITIAASNGAIGGTATLHVTSGTAEEWKVGEARYNNGVEFDLMIDFSQIIDPNWMPPIPPPNLACNNCHSTGAKYFEIQHTPTQEARFSDDELVTILSKGMKPAGVGFRVLPAMVGDMTDVELYAAYHKWDASPEEIKGLIIYLRSLTPTGMGDILLPDGTYAPAGSMPMP